jgi:K+-sensing histidine kinase KdpD
MDMGRLFDKFYRVRQPLEGSRPGMGIGLTVARGLSRAMRGDIVAERSDLGGLALRVRLPAVMLPGDPEDDPGGEEDDVVPAAPPGMTGPAA